MSNSYNGFSWAERMAKYHEMERQIASGELPRPHGPCRLCNDPGGDGSNVVFEYHDEDYGREYSWREPATYVLCRDCHIYRVHQRFARPQAWLAFLAHVRRGGHAREMRDPDVKDEIAKLRAAIKNHKPCPGLRQLRPYPAVAGEEWFSKLNLEQP